MARTEHIISQTPIKRSASYSYKKKNYPQGPDINEFIISALDPQSGNVKETLTLSGTHLPFQPFVAPVSQEILKYYYPGGEAERTPVVQVLGSIDEDVILVGRFKATKIQDVNRRNEPLIISNILTRFVKEGNVCLFQLGDWIKYGMLRKSIPKYKTDSDIEWELHILVIGDKNPITGEQQEQTNEIARVFSSDEVEDVTALAQQISLKIEESKNELEEVYLPKVDIVPFSISAYLKELLLKRPQGDVATTAQAVYDAYVNITETVDNIITELEDFASKVERTSFEITRTIFQVQSQISRIYQVQEDLVAAFSEVSATLPIFKRLGSLNTYGNIINLSNNLLLDFKNTENSLRSEQFSSVQQTYVAKEGDTYQSISTRFYDTWQRWEELKNLNGYGETLQGGEILIIPR